jgi:hypothetical protein
MWGKHIFNWFYNICQGWFRTLFYFIWIAFGALTSFPCPSIDWFSLVPKRIGGDPKNEAAKGQMETGNYVMVGILEAGLLISLTTFGALNNDDDWKFSFFVFTTFPILLLFACTILFTNTDSWPDILPISGWNFHNLCRVISLARVIIVVSYGSEILTESFTLDTLAFGLILLQFWTMIALPVCETQFIQEAQEQNLPDYEDGTMNQDHMIRGIVTMFISMAIYMFLHLYLDSYDLSQNWVNYMQISYIVQGASVVFISIVHKNEYRLLRRFTKCQYFSMLLIVPSFASHILAMYAYVKYRTVSLLEEHPAIMYAHYSLMIFFVFELYVGVWIRTGLDNSVANWYLEEILKYARRKMFATCYEWYDKLVDVSWFMSIEPFKAMLQSMLFFIISAIGALIPPLGDWDGINFFKRMRESTFLKFDIICVGFTYLNLLTGWIWSFFSMYLDDGSEQSTTQLTLSCLLFQNGTWVIVALELGYFNQFDILNSRKHKPVVKIQSWKTLECVVRLVLMLWGLHRSYQDVLYNETSINSATIIGTICSTASFTCTMYQLVLNNEFAGSFNDSGKQENHDVYVRYVHWHFNCVYLSVWVLYSLARRGLGDCAVYAYAAVVINITTLWFNVYTLSDGKVWNDLGSNWKLRYMIYVCISVFSFFATVNPVARQKVEFDLEYTIMFIAQVWLSAVLCFWQLLAPEEIRDINQTIIWCEGNVDRSKDSSKSHSWCRCCGGKSTSSDVEEGKVTSSENVELTGGKNEAGADIPTPSAPDQKETTADVGGSPTSPEPKLKPAPDQEETSIE